MSRRYPRAHFTKVLHRVFERLDSVTTRPVEWTQRFPLVERIRTVATIERVWVFGSYSRGALDCGDLDLIVEVSSVHENGERANRPPTPTVSRLFFGSAPDVRIYLGTPADRIAGLENIKAVQIWGRERFDWRVALAGIKDDPHSTRFKRRTDAIPLRMEQLNATLEKVESVIEAHANGLLKWSFVPLPNPTNDQAASKLAGHFQRMADYAGRKTSEVAPHVLAFMESRDTYFGDDISWDGNTIVWGGATLLIGRPSLPSHLLDSINSFEIDLVPHISRRGPNGIWTIARGPEHPIVKQLSGKTLYTYAWGDRPQFIGRLCDMQWREGNTTTLFACPKAALDFAMDVDDEAPATIYSLTGDNLLAMIASADVIEIGDCGVYPATCLGQLLLEADRVSTTDEIIEALLNA
ncbi:hypothetical protein D9M68_377160 [compost metagenome]